MLIAAGLATVFTAQPDAAADNSTWLRKSAR
jgi:hypothetical protein